MAAVVVVVAILVLGRHLPGCQPLSKTDINFTIALDRDQRIGANYNVRFIPVTLLIDEKGVVRGIWPGAFGSKEHVIAWLDDVTSSEAPPPVSTVAPEVGHVAPDFTLVTLEGDTVTLSQLGDKWVLLNFWTTRCLYCVIQMPYLQAAFEERGDEIAFIAVNLGENEEKVREFFGG